ncbi:hypothetical protein H0266_10995 [Halobacillus locisalis]|uniref:Uncharacterized protein n=1 Tax=Halobacillus locisalis TaxID=220753 RepID=A0A838CU22_9BACI|nr:hypothetical protein [Halobacillus locisalis]MBA2175421.1 hypothetical protein [Halobacillus locisalis]
MKEKGRSPFFKSKWFWLNAGICVVVFAVAFFLGSSRMNALLDGELLKYDELVVMAEDKDKEILEKESSVKSLQGEIDGMNEEKGQLNEQIQSKQKDLEEVMALIDSKDQLSEEIAGLEEQRNTNQGELTKLTEQLTVKEKELASVTGKIIELKDKPKVLPAGFFTVGQDIPASRYKVTPNGSGNFFVNDGMKVNVIIGQDDSFYLSEYVFYAEEGDLIELTTPATFQPVQ